MLICAISTIINIMPFTGHTFMSVLKIPCKLFIMHSETATFTTGVCRWLAHKGVD